MLDEIIKTIEEEFEKAKAEGYDAGAADMEKEMAFLSGWEFLTDDVGKWIKAARIKQGIKQSDIAEKAFISPQGLSAIETQKRHPTIQSALSIIEALGYKVIIVKENK